MHLSQGVLKKKILQYVPMHFYGFNPGPPWDRAVLDPETNLIKKHLAILNFKHLSQVRPFKTPSHHLNKIDKRLLGHSTYQLSCTGARGSDEGFLNIFLCISIVQSQELLAWSHFRLGGHHLNKHFKGPLGHATYPISST